MDTLKGVDRARAEVLFDAAEKANCVAHLALLTHWQHGSAEGGDFGYGGRRSERWISYDDEMAPRPSTHTMGEVHDYGLSIDHWSDRHGKKVAFGEMTLRTEEIVSDVPYEDWELSREDFEGYTGNAGMTLERWYHRAAIVIWPSERNSRVLCDAGTVAAISGLQVMIDQWKCAPKNDQKRQHERCLEFATAIIDTWAPGRFHYHSYARQVRVDRSTFLVSLQHLDAPEPVCCFLTQVMPSDAGLQINEEFPAYCKRHGWPTFEAGLSAILTEASPPTIVRNVALLEMLCLGRDKNASRLAVCARLAEHTVTALEKLDNETSADPWEMRTVDRSALLCSLVRSLLSVEAAGPMAHLIDHILSHDATYDLTEAHLAAIFALEPLLYGKIDKMKLAISEWLAHCRSQLQQRTVQPPVAPTDFRRASELRCHCADCVELSRFLADPSQSVHRFRVRQDRRRHLHGIINENRCDLTHVTLRTSNPQTLVCTKTTASYEAACQTYSRDCENLARLQTIAEKATIGGERDAKKGKEPLTRRPSTRKR